jgi:probable rRNA maturation factor
VRRAPSPTLPRKRRRAKKDNLLIEIIVQSARWKQQPKAAHIVRKSISAAAIATSTPRAELAIVLTNDSAIRALNRDWCGLDAPTNVLSFPAAKKILSLAGPPLLGDVVIAYQTVAREARDEAKPFAHHLAHLVVHGYLHLVGCDHDNDRKARRMERLEVAILAKLGVPDPYARHVGT